MEGVDRLMTFKDDPRPLLAFDWSANELDCTFDGDKVFTVKRAEDLLLLPELAAPHRLVCEASFESFVPGRRQAKARELRDAGHELYVFRSTATERYRRRHGIEKTNVNDAQVIYKIATETATHIYPLMDPDPEWAEERERINKEYYVIKMAKDKPKLLINPAKKVLGRFSKLTPEQQQLWGDGKAGDYSKTLLAAVYYATSITTNRTDFERVLGLWQSAHPALMRSEVYHHAWGVTWNTFKQAQATGSPRKRDVALTDWRRGIRQMRAKFIEAGVGGIGSVP
jgi:hypothetical protein